MADIHRIEIGSMANLKVAGTNLKLSGRVSDLKTNVAGNTQTGRQEQYIPTGTVTIEPEGLISADYIDRPVFVEFLLK